MTCKHGYMRTQKLNIHTNTHTWTYAPMHIHRNIQYKCFVEIRQ